MCAGSRLPEQPGNSKRTMRDNIHDSRMLPDFSP
jgi:hypothetical protein